jgi:arylsulfatase A-like enzyme
MIWDTPMLAVNDYNYTRGFDGVYFVHGQKGDPWITSPSLPIRMPAQPHKIKSPSSLASYLRNHFYRQYEHEYCVARTLTAATEWLEANHQHRSFFLYVDMWDPHEPFDCPWYDHALYADPDYDGGQMLYPQYGRPTYMTDEEHANARALYSGNATLVDRWVGHFLNMAERLGLFSNTLIIWTTDHGHLFGEHNLQGKPGATLGMLYEVTTRIPLLVYHPEGLGAGKRVTGIVQPPDILPSILEFLGIACPLDVQGRSFWPLVISGPSSRVDTRAYMSSPSPAGFLHALAIPHTQLWREPPSTGG